MKTTTIPTGRCLDDVGLSAKKQTTKCWKGKSSIALFATMLIGLFFADRATAQITLRGTASQSTTGTTLTINKPNGLTVGDFMIANITQGDNDNDAMGNATRTGWTLIAGELYGSTGSNRYYGTILYKVADAADVAANSYAFTLSSDGDDGVGGIIAFAGVDTANPFDGAPGTINNINADDLSAPSITTSAANSAIVMLGMVADNRSISGWGATNPASLSEIYDTAVANDVDMQSGAAWAIKATAGATGNGFAELSNNENDWNGALLIALRRFTGVITTGAIAGPFCSGSDITVPYTVTGETFGGSNVFTAQLSNASGSFASPTNIGSVTASTSGNISATLPAVSGTGYRIRVISSSTAAVGSNNGSNINILAAPTAVAGSNFNACETAVNIAIGTGASSNNNSGVLWTSNGTGTISNETSVTGATYTPGIGETGTVIFTLTATGNAPCGDTSANKTMTLVAPPTASAGGSATTCSNQPVVVSGASASNGNISWADNGTGSITAGGNTVAPTYTPGAGENGEVTLTMTVTNASCGSVQATFTVNVVAAATASAGAPLAICTNDGAMPIGTGATAANHAGVTWTSNGTGSIANANDLNGATYAPGVGETGNVTLTLTATGNTPCGDVVVNKVLTINPVPDTSNTVICQGESGTLNSSTSCPSEPSVTTGAQFAGAGATSGTGTAWGGTGNLGSNNNQYASFTGQGITSQTLSATNFGFNIPANAVVLGVEATIARHRSGTALGGDTRDNSVRLIKGGSAVGANKGFTSTNWPSSEATQSYGANSDLWGESWTAADINASNFGLALVVDIAGALGNRTGNVDYIQLAVTYQVPGEIRWYTAASGGTLLGSGSSFNPVGVAGSPLADTNTPGTTDFYAECSTIPGCRSLATFTINALPTVSFTAMDASYCGNDASVVLTGNHAPAGTFSGPGVTDNADGTATFDPAVAGPGAHDIVYSYTDGNICTNTATQNVTVIAPTTYYADADGDGFGNIAVTELSCDGPSSGFVANNTDCDDADNTKNATFDFYVDADGDGFGAGSLVPVCAVDANTPPTGYSLSGTDCNDADNTMNATFSFYTDSDVDGYGTGDLVAVCAVDANTPPAGYSLNNTDCNDSNGGVFQMGTLYVDSDNDGYTSGATEEICYGAAAPSGYILSLTAIDCNDNVFAINPGHAEVLYNGVDDDCDGTLDEGNQLTTTLLPSSCGATLASISSLVGIQTVGGHQITGYRVRATNGAQVQVIERNVPHFIMPSFPSHDYATTYTIEIELQRAGVWLGYYGAPCQVSTPAILAEGGAATVSPSQCGTTLPHINTLIATTSIQGVTGYRFRVTNLTDPLGPNAVQTITRTQNWFSLQMLTRYNYGTQYRIEVAVKTTGDFGGYGATCELSSPAAPSLVNCGGTIAAKHTPIACNSVSGATQYRFQIVRASDLASATVDRNTNFFNFNMIPSLLYTAGAVYNVRVAVMTSGNWSPLGDACEITSPAALGKGIAETAPLAEESTMLKATAYPNPFTADFTIDVATPSTQKVSVKVYDMLGKLVESREVDAADRQIERVGSQFPAGVYNVIVNQDGNVRTLRVIKR
ncbi:T9SS type A sorting domain-containing protein [Flavobacterium caeni]|nr:T9SS type A sorting domain-containing protein [Flavobacterium caeni]